MKKRVFFGQNDIRYFYYRYKDSRYYAISIFALTITVCIMLLFGVIIPQIEKYLSIRTEVIAMREKISLINQNISFMNTLDKGLLAKQLETVSLALPIEKDFAGILKALSDSSVRAGVTLADFNFSVGEVSSKSATKTNNNLSGSLPSAVPSPNLQGDSPTLNNSLSDTTTIDFTVIVNGSVDRVNLFIKEIGEKLPISEVVSINNDNNTTTLNLKFHYKKYPDINYKEDDPIKPLSKEKAELIEELSSWRISSSEEIFMPIGTNSAAPLFE
jgi:hypothetical protein